MSAPDHRWIQYSNLGNLSFAIEAGTQFQGQLVGSFMPRNAA
jgi:hypothetical protein